MTYTAPTVSDFQTRFPEFDEVEDEVVQFALDDAARFTDSEWIDADRFTGTMMLAAHAVQTAAGSYDNSGLQSISVGSISVTYSMSKGVGTLEKTSYGVRFKALQLANRRGPRVA